jgi:hypothetical protein
MHELRQVSVARESVLEVAERGQAAFGHQMVGNRIVDFELSAQFLEQCLGWNGLRVFWCEHQLAGQRERHDGSLSQ